MNNVLKFLGGVVTLLIAGCVSDMVSTWKAPDAAPLELAGSKVAAMVMVQDVSLKRAAEDALAQDITARGAIGVPMYTILPGSSDGTEAEAKAALEKGGYAAVVTMRPTAVDKDVVSTPVTYVRPGYDPFWGGYYGYGWSHAYAMGGQTYTNTILTIETLVYSLKQNKLVWGGQSRLTNPSNVDEVIKKTARNVAAELEKAGLIRKQ